VTVYGVKNPKIAGGTGNFILRTKKGKNLIDENTIFGSIGIASKVYTLTSVIIGFNRGSLMSAGEYTTYLIKFTNNKYIPENTYIKLTVPIESGYVLEKFPACSSYPLNNKVLGGVLQCETVGKIVFIRGKEKII